MGLFSSSEKIENDLITDPRMAPYYELMGLGRFEYDDSLGLKQFGSGKDSSAMGLFGGGKQGRQGLSAIFEYLNSDPNQMMLSGGIGGMNALGGEWNEDRGEWETGSYNDARNFFKDSIAPGLEDLVTTGFRTDTEGIKAAAMDDFQRNIVPQALEHLTGDFGLGSSGTRNQLMHSSQDLANSLAGMDYAADESAAGRRMQGMSLADMLNTNNIARDIGFGTDIMNLGYLTNEMENSKGSRMWGALQQMTGNPGSPTPYVQGYRDKPGLLSQVGDGLGDVTSIVGELGKMYAMGG